MRQRSVHRVIFDSQERHKTQKNQGGDWIFQRKTRRRDRNVHSGARQDQKQSENRLIDK